MPIYKHGAGGHCLLVQPHRRHAFKDTVWDWAELSPPAGWIVIKTILISSDLLSYQIHHLGGKHYDQIILPSAHEPGHKQGESEGGRNFNGIWRILNYQVSIEHTCPANTGKDSCGDDTQLSLPVCYVLDYTCSVFFYDQLKSDTLILKSVSSSF